MPSYESIYTGSQIDTAVGRARVGGAIDTSLSRKADTATHNLKTYTNLAQLDISGEFTMAQLDSAMPTNSTLCAYISPTQDAYLDDYPTTYGVLTVLKTNTGRMNCEFMSVTDGQKVWTGIYTVALGWDGWQQIATATTPTWYTLGLADTIVASDVTNVPAYYKNGSGECVINGRVSLPHKPANGTYLATLPVGFRSNKKIFGVLVSMNGYVTQIYTSPDGSLKCCSDGNDLVALNYWEIVMPPYYCEN